VELWFICVHKHMYIRERDRKRQDFRKHLHNACTDTTITRTNNNTPPHLHTHTTHPPPPPPSQQTKRQPLPPPKKNTQINLENNAIGAEAFTGAVRARLPPTLRCLNLRCASHPQSQSFIIVVHLRLWVVSLHACLLCFALLCGVCLNRCLCVPMCKRVAAWGRLDGYLCIGRSRSQT
jgi:hypothetical protein